MQRISFSNRPFESIRACLRVRKVNSLWQSGFRRFTWEEREELVDPEWKNTEEKFPPKEHTGFRKTEIALIECDKLKKKKSSFETSDDTSVLKGCFVRYRCVFDSTLLCVKFCYEHAQ